MEDRLSELIAPQVMTEPYRGGRRKSGHDATNLKPACLGKE